MRFGKILRMKRRRISSALAGIAVSCAVGAALWPHAREALVLLSSQDEPAELADTQINSALRNNQKIVADNIEQALAKGDADLAAALSSWRARRMSRCRMR